ncbi:DNA replication endonuclease-helicase Dna2 [Umbelopsis sp. WA50703]
MSDSFRTPVQPDKKTENDDDDWSGELTPEAWFKSPTVKTLKRRQLPPESSNEVGQHWFASRADALTVFERPASSISDLFETSPQRRSSSPLAPMQKRDQTTKYLTVGSSIPLLKKLQLEKDSNKRVLSKEIPMSPKRQNQPPAAKKPRNSSPPSSQQSDDFGDDIPIEELDAILAMTNPQPVAQPVVQKESKVSRLQNYRRLLVMEIHNGTYHVDDSDTQLVEKVLYLLDEKTNTEHTVKLRQDWVHTEVSCGDTVHVISPNIRAVTTVIDNISNLIIVHPDTLISSTAVSDSFICIRKAVLRDRIRDLADFNEALVHGNILHRVFQNTILSQDFSVDNLQKEIAETVASHLDQLYAIGQSDQTAILILERFITSMQAWAAKYLTSQPSSNAVVSSDRGPSFGQPGAGPVVVGVEKVLDIEEHIWSPMYGLKGMIDVSIQANIRQGRRVHTLTIPMEIKTGKKAKILAHRAQTILYTLLMHDRYDIDITTGMLFYSLTNEVLLVPPLRDEVRGLIIGRNNLATAFKDTRNLPPMIKNLQTCQRCYSVNSCTIYHKSVERGTPQSSGLGKMFDDKTSHLNDAHTQFFRKWDELIQLEEGDIHKLRRGIWTAGSKEKELMGRCWSNMEVIGKPEQDDVDRHLYIFQRHHQVVATAARSGEEASQKARMLHSHISIGDPIVVSSEDAHINLGIGFVSKLSSNSVTVSLTRPFRGVPSRIDHQFDEKENQAFVGVVDASTSQRDQTLYRIDKDEINSGMGLVRNNLLTLMLKENDGGDIKRRRLIVDLEEPQFATVMPHVNEGLSFDLNPDQLHAAHKVLSAQDYCLILGMPGTGKTTTIAQIIRILVEQGKSILLTSYTHTAVDNVLSKVKESGIEVLRVGNPEKVSPALRDSMPNTSEKSMRELVDLYESRKVVGTTCLGIGERRRFDYCIVDEASQLTLPVCIGPLQYANVFVLVGDHYQLPPLVRSEEATKKGLTKSLFKLLSEAHPSSVVYLEHQYRMNKDIMALSNHLIYDGRLKCGTEAVAHMTLDIPAFSAGSKGLHVFTKKNAHHNHAICNGSSCWLEHVIDPKRAVLFVDTDQVPAEESRLSGTVIHNTQEATLVHQTVEMLLSMGVSETKVGVITPYRSQLRLIQQLLKGRERVEVHTIDKYQGRDKECVVVSLVRSNANGLTGDLLKDWRRLNVALTRAKRKLIVFGSRSTLQHASLFRSFLQLVEDNGWIFTLAKDAQWMHHVPQAPSQSPRKKSPKVHTVSDQLVLKDREILRDVYNSI